MYYGLIIMSVVMFGANFALQDVYRKMRGSGLRISLESSFIGSLAGLVVLLVVNGFQNGLQFEVTPFTLIMALLAALNGFAFTFCSFRALEVINLSLFSLFSMLGGMVLPFFQGIIFYGEKLTVGKIVCVLFICAALLLTVDRSEEKKKGTIYYVGIFVLNGMSGVLTKLYNELPFEKVSSAGYSIWMAMCTMTIAGILWLALFSRKKHDRPYTFAAGALCAVHGGLGKVANFLLVIALLHVDSSAQYPLVTGGVMIVSTLICFFGDRKPSKRELISVGLAFVGMLSLFLIKI